MAKKVAKAKVKKVETEEVEAEKVTQGLGKPLHSVITPSGKLLKLTDEEFKEFKEKK